MALTPEQLQALGLDAPPPDPNAVMKGQPAGSPPILAPQPTQYPRSILHGNIPTGALIPTTHEQGKEEFEQYMPQITAPSGTMAWQQQRQAQLDYKSQHPWGAPISAHPGTGGKILHDLSTAGQIAGMAFGPTAVMEALTPNTILHNAIESRGNLQGMLASQQQETAASEAQSRATGAAAEKERADTERDVADNGKTGLTPEEVTIHDLMTGNNGQPRVDPNTKKPYTYMSAFQAVQDAKQEAKPGTAAHVNYDAGIPVSVTDENKKTYDVNDPKLPPALKPLVDSANRAHGQHVDEDLKKQATLFAHEEKMRKESEDAAAKKLGDKNSQGVQDTLDEIAESRDYAKTPSATNDYGLLLNFIGLTKPESLAKLRLNQNEVTLAQGTRGILGDLEALKSKVENGQMLTPDQRQAMLSTMSIVEKYANRRLQRLQASGGRATPAAGNSNGRRVIDLTQ